MDQPCVPRDFWTSLFHSALEFLPGELFTFAAVCYAAVAVALTVFLHHYWKKFDLFRDFSDIGFESVSNEKGNRKGTDATRKNAINELRKRRKIGDLPPVYPNGWFAVLESDKLPMRTAVEVSAVGENLVAWRGDSGACYIADAYCPHLGAHLGVGGKVKGECITCPFHSWSFDGCSGKLTNIPYADSVPEFARLKMWTTMEIYGYICLWYHAEDHEPTWWPDEIPDITSGQWKYRGRSEFLVACHIQEIPENGADAAHLNVLHTAPILQGGNPDDATIDWNFIKHVWTGSWAANTDPERLHEALLTVTHHINLFNKYDLFNVAVQVHQLGPGLVLMHFDTILGKGVLIHTVTPIEPLLQKVSHRFYSAKTFIQPFGRLLLSAEAIQIERDIRIWNRKSFIYKPILTKEDKLIKSFRRWFSQFYSENSPKHTFGKNDANANQLDF